MPSIDQTLRLLALAAPLCFALAPHAAVADDAPSPCAALKRIVAAAPQRFAGLSPDDARGVVQPYGDDAQCAATSGAWHCRWTPHGDAGSNTAALQSVAADVAACLPDATHDQNSPGRQHFYLGPRGRRVDITLTPAGARQLRLVVTAAH